MNIAVLDADTLGLDLDLSPLAEFGEVRVFPSSAPDEISSHIGDCEVAIVNKLKMNAAAVGDAPALRLICVFATGYDNIDLDFCRRRGIAVCNVVGYSTASVAQLTIAMALSLATHLPAFTFHVASGAYSAGGAANCLVPVYHEIAGMTWGIVGYGNIGRAVGKAAKAMGCRVLAYKRTPSPDANVVDLDTLCRESDIISVHLPLNDGTRGLFSAEQTAKIKKGAIFINVARGAVTDESALAAAVIEGRLGGLGVDVYTAEPFPADHPFYAIRNLPNVCLTPHMAWGSREARERCLWEICENIRVFSAGGMRCRVDL
ncbi:MAG: hydroxyacid dehydrogenase [Clostridia bacterium]|nr:hydroxyacid dehydrogenase [Clostridia bacterium]